MEREEVARGEKVYTVELLPPSGITPKKLLDNAQRLKEAGVDAINIPDGPRACSKMSTIISAVMVDRRSASKRSFIARAETVT